MKIIIILFMTISVSYSTDATRIIQKIVNDTQMDSIINESNGIILQRNIVTKVFKKELETKLKVKILVKNKHAAKYGNFVLNETEFIHIEDISVSIKDTSGNLIKELDEDDIEEMIFHDGYEINIKKFSLTHDIFPYILEFEVDREIDTHFRWPNWITQYDIPTLYSSYKLIFDDNILYKTHNIGIDLTSGKYIEDGDSVHSWELMNIPPRLLEDYLPPENKIQNGVLFTPLEFEYGKSKGSLNTWNDIAAWYRLIAQDRYELPESAKEEVKTLIKSETDKNEIIRILYQYLQDKTRYVQIYMDIGGWQPHKADWIFNNRFGDCKDLSTLMISMLEFVGIDAYPALVLTRDEGLVYENFPNNRFNHCIAFVPLENDSIWLECTADYIGYKDIPFNIEGINVLVVKENSGEIIRTSQKSARENKQHSISNGQISSTGTLSIHGKICYSGNQKKRYTDIISVQKPEDIERTIIKDISYYTPGFKMDNYSFSSKEDESLQLEVKGQYNKFAKKVGNRIFLNPNILNRKSQKNIPEDIKRNYPIKMVDYPYLDIDSLVVSIPNGYTIESAPGIKNITKSFGRYKTSYKFENNIFTYNRIFEFTRRLIDPVEYQELVEFYQAAIETDKTNFVFKKM